MIYGGQVLLQGYDHTYGWMDECVEATVCLSLRGLTPTSYTRRVCEDY